MINRVRATELTVLIYLLKDISGNFPGSIKFSCLAIESYEYLPELLYFPRTWGPLRKYELVCPGTGRQTVKSYCSHFASNFHRTEIANVEWRRR